MMALTLWQPWASLIVHGPKRIENRTWRPPADLIGKRLAIHAGRKFDREGFPELQEKFPDLCKAIYDRSLPTGVVLGSVIIVAVEDGRGRWRDDPWFSGPYGWVLDNVIPLHEPMPAKGARGIWPLPPEIIGAAFRQSVLDGTGP